MFGKRNTTEADTAYSEKKKQYGGCPPCDDCEGSGQVSDTQGCDPCWSTGIDPGPNVPARSQSSGRSPWRR
ncbi:hypothetical protein [Streptomyces sp. R08]|uniref:Uncharacterized protein n=1 Tax=Streptomyces sp. R08 TaxID=3238624 RepID=A0AB39LYZ8_9ACTN